MESGESGIAALLEEKLGLFEKIFRCAERQATLQIPEQLSEYQSLMETRQSYMEAVTKLDMVINRQAAAVNDQPFADQVNRRIREWIIRIMEADRKNKVSLQRELGQLKQRMESIRLGKKGTSGYLRCGAVAPTGAYTNSLR